MDDLLKQAQELAISGETAKAAVIYEEILADGKEAISLLLHNLTACLLKVRSVEPAYRAALASTYFAPQLPRTWLALAHIEAKLGHRDAALASIYRALELEPTNQSFHETRLWNLAQKLEPLDYRREAEAWYASLEPVAATYRHNLSFHSLGRKIRVGYVSGDFRLHVMDRFIEALLAHHDYDRFEVLCFDNSPLRDKISVRMRTSQASWYSIKELSDAKAADLIYNLGVDVLVDLSGLSAHNRLSIFRRRPAPLQITGVGFLPATGADCFDYRLGDYEFQDQYTEPLWKISRAAVPLPLHAEVPVSSSPAASKGYVTFGYVNGLHKLTPESIRSFVEVLNSVPTSKLVVMLPGASDGATARSVLRRFDPVQDRVILTESNGGLGFVELFKSIDVCLDPAPYGGCTTTIDCLFHGVPVATSFPDRRLAADAFFLQRELGLNPSGTLLLDACRWAEDLASLADARAWLRSAYLAHPVGRPDEWVKSLEVQYAAMLDLQRERAAA